MARRSPAFLHRLATLLGATLIAGGCAALAPIAPADVAAWSFFEAPDAGDLWSPQITGWQRRERALPSSERHRTDGTPRYGAVSEAGAGLDTPSSGAVLQVPSAAAPAERTSAPSGSDLREEWLAFRVAQKRALARSAADWIQREARDHYLPDGPVDHWATLEQTLARNGDDCDGLELLTYHFLLELGFRQDEVYRAIVHRPSDGQHHMVTFWFEDPADPWVIDPTGAMTSGMPRLSQVPGWVPLKVFSETAEHTVRPRPAAAAGLGERASH